MASLDHPLLDRVGSPEPRADRITATEVINGVQHRIVLERDAQGRYREVSLTPLEPVEPHLANDRQIQL